MRNELFSYSFFVVLFKNSKKVIVLQIAMHYQVSNKALISLQTFYRLFTPILCRKSYYLGMIIYLPNLLRTEAVSATPVNLISANIFNDGIHDF